jgi:ribosomal protein S12 methylthiotransferase accessory factor
VTRVARVTGLDRAGVEVACAVRPGGHVLQVSNGKGDTFEEAARGAVLEAAELACAEASPDVAAFASAAELAQRGVAFVGEDALGGAASGHRLAWVTAEDLASGGTVLAPAAAVHVPPQGGALLGLASVRWTSNGMGAHPLWAAALLHALVEAVERDQLARALPEGFTEDEVARRRIGREALARVAPGVAARSSSTASAARCPSPPATPARSTPPAPCTPRSSRRRSRGSPTSTGRGRTWRRWRRAGSSG